MGLTSAQGSGLPGPFQTLWPRQTHLRVWERQAAGSVGACAGRGVAEPGRGSVCCARPGALRSEGLPPPPCRALWLSLERKFVECRSRPENLRPCLAVTPSFPRHRFMRPAELLFKQSLKSSVLQISPLSDQLHVFCMK